jgi:hypothetical protein
MLCARRHASYIGAMREDYEGGDEDAKRQQRGVAGVEDVNRDHERHSSQHAGKAHIAGQQQDDEPT